MNSSRRLADQHGRGAAALIIVLAFVVLLTGLIVAFFSSSLLYRQISNSSANAARVDLMAQGAVDTIVSDVKQEIAAGSNATLYTDPNSTPVANKVVGQVYRPFNAITAVPAPSLKVNGYPTITAFAPNLVKRSAYSQNFFPAGSDPNASYYNNGNTSETVSVSASPSPAPPPATACPPSNRAANVSSVTPSLNGRYVSLARWNKHLLLPKASYVANGSSDTNTTDYTPVTPKTSVTSLNPSSATGNFFVPPDWVLLARNGANPTAWNSNLITSNTAPTTVVGRYAYAIYDEGGLLDANAAGYPILGNPNGSPPNPLYTSSNSTALAAYKYAEAFADLSQLPGISTLSTLSLQKLVIDSIVGWRNYASAQPTKLLGSYTFASASLNNFTTAVLTNSTGFLKANNANPNLTIPYNGQTDRLFTSRQAFINFLLKGITSAGTALTSTSEANLQNALQYLTTFSRGLSQPSFIRPQSTNANKTFDYNSTVPAVQPLTSGGNNAVGSDDKINPSFLSVRVQTTISGGRNDGTDLAVGEPLVKKRFALNRLAWLTYLGPIATASGTYNTLVPATYLTALKTTYGFTDAFLLQGTPANIQKYFGLTWALDSSGSTGAGDSEYKWFYNVHLASSGGGGPILKLGDIATLSASSSPAVHEPDFFELLKASIGVGSLAKSLGGTGADTSVDYHVIQIGANIVDQFDLDGFPTRIIFNDGTGPREFAGVENVPYAYAYRTSNFRVEMAVPDVTGYYSGFAQNTVYPTSPGPPAPPPGGYVSDAGGRSCGQTARIQYAPTSATSETQANTAVPTLSKTGVVLMTMLPELWNPHDQNATRCALDSSGNPITDGTNPLFPTAFRVVAVSGGPPPSVPTAFGYTACCGFAAYPANSQSNSDINGTAVPFPVYASVPGQSSYGGFGTHSRKMTTANTGMYFTLPNTTAGGGMLRERTILYRVGGAIGLSGIDPSGGHQNNALLSPDPTTDGTFSDGGVSFVSGTTASDGIIVPSNLTGADGYNAIFEPRPDNTPSGTLNRYLGLYVDAFPMAYASNTTGENFQTMDQTTNGIPGGGFTAMVQCWAPSANPSGGGYSTSGSSWTGQWITYDTKSFYIANEQMMNRHAQTGSSLPNEHVSAYDVNGGGEYIDPRTARLGPFYNANPFPYLSYLSTTPYWVDNLNGITYNAHPDYQSGTSYAMNGVSGSFGFYGAVGSSSYTSQLDLFSQNRSDVFDDNEMWVNSATNTPPNPLQGVYYTDADGVLRRAMGAYVKPTATTPAPSTAPYVGLPMATASTITVSSNPSNTTTLPNTNGQSQSRPFILNRPFRSVTELGYVFSGTPWKNLDFFTPESGESAMLDTFCINDTDNTNGLVAGKLNLNTKQTPVLTAALSGGYKDETNSFSVPPTYALAPLTIADATNVAGALQSRTGVTGSTTTLNSTTSAPLTNIASLVGGWSSLQKLSSSAPASASSPNNVDGSKSYDGLSADLDKITYSASSSTTTTIQRFRSAAIQPLENMGNTRVWNLMIDLVAQTGRYPASATALNNFVVEGEQRYWVHLAIDRYTGQVIDKQVEIVKE